MNSVIEFEFNMFRALFSLIKDFWFLGVFIAAPAIVLVLSTIFSLIFKSWMDDKK